MEEAAGILVVDDDRGMRTTLVATLEDYGYRLNACESGQEALATIQQSPPDVVLADLRLPDLDGLDLVQTLKAVNAEAAFILVTGYASVDTAVEALNKGAYAYITKPFNMDEVHSVIRNALMQQKLVRGNKRLVEILQQTNKELNLEVAQRASAEEALQNSLRRMKIAYDQTTIYAQELREEIAQRKRTEAALVRSEELRRLLAAQEARDQERKRLAEELHDETLAQLSSVAVDMGFLSRNAEQLPQELLQGLDEIRSRVRDAELSLQQGLVNAIQHAHANMLQVELTWSDKELSVSITDDGDGFDVENLQHTPASGHFGLVNLRDRIEALDGFLEIESQPSVGTTLRVMVPTEREGSGSKAVQRSVYILPNQDPSKNGS